VSSENKHIYTLLQLAENIQQMVQKTYTAQYWIKAELHKLNYYPRSGHCYPEFTEKQNGKIVAEMRGMIWNYTYQHIQENFLKITGEPLRDGINILMLVSVQFHPVNGLKLIVQDIDPQYTLGDLARQRAECIERLKQEGLFERNQTLPFPILPKRLAIISVETSKGYRDLLSILDENTYGYRFLHTLFPAFLQGEQAVSSITAQLKSIAKQADQFDLILLIRGGGGDAGLSAYDQYELASVVAQSPLPVVTGIGHATNQTVTELVAAKNFITPSEVGYFLIQQFLSIEQRLDGSHQRIEQAVEQIFSRIDSFLQQLTHRFQIQSANTLHRYATYLQQISHHFFVSTQKLLQTHIHNMEHVWPERLSVHSTSLLRMCEQRINAIQGKVQLLSPEATLKRGYSIVRHKEKAITNTHSLQIGDELHITLYQGELITEIKKKLSHA